MSLSNQSKAYGTAAITVAFVAGVLLTLAFKDLYPDLGHRYRRRLAKASPSLDSQPSSNYVLPVKLEDHTKRQSIAETRAPIAEGIESTIGNTPLFKLKSLSA